MRSARERFECFKTSGSVTGKELVNPLPAHLESSSGLMGVSPSSKRLKTITWELKLGREEVGIPKCHLCLDKSVNYFVERNTLSSTSGKLFWAEEFNRNIVRISRGYGPGIYNVLNRAMFEPQLVQSSRPIPNFTFGYTSKADVVQPNS